MPENAVPAEWQPIFLFFSALAAVYGSAMWVTSDPAHNNRPYWVIALAGMAVGSVTRGLPQASLAWGTTLALTGSVLFLFTAQNRKILFIPLLALVGLVGLPFTPSATGWPGLIGPSFDLYGFLFMLAALMLCGGFLRRVFHPRDELYIMERWIQTIYPTGLLILIIAQWGILIANWREGLTFGVWWASTLVLLLAVFVSLFVISRRAQLEAYAANARWLVILGQRIGGGLAAIFRLNWLYQMLVWGYGLLQSAIHLLTAIFEGDGGILWALVMLGLLISLVMAGGAP